MSKGTNTIRFIRRQDIPKSKKVTYIRLVTSLQTHKKEINWVQITVGGNKLLYTDITATQQASLTTTKCSINSTLSTKNAKFMSVDIKDYYYGTVLKKFEYMHMELCDIPDKIILQYGLKELKSGGWVSIQIENGMLGLK